jgi:hypothetical protein
VGALALLAGHTWGLMVSIPSHVTLAGHVWPALAAKAGLNMAAAAPSGSLELGAMAVVLVTALPALALTAFVLPQIASHLFHDRGRRVRGLFVAGSALALAASLIVPALP